MANKKLKPKQVAAIKLQQEQNGIPLHIVGFGKILKIADEPSSSDILDVTTNQDNPLNEYPKKEFKLWVVKEPNSSEKLGGSETIVRSQHYGQAVDDYIIDWNKRKRLNRTIGYPVVQGKKI